MSLLGAVHDAEAALQAARTAWYAELPAFPADGVCTECGGTSWLYVEDGYTRFTSGEWQIDDEDEPGFLHLYTDGWDDMSESGDFEYAQCDNMRGGGCGKSYQCSDTREYD